MTTLDNIPAESDPVHLLLVGDSKSGKSTYSAEAAIAGFNVIYVDGDNGVSALRYALRNHPEAMKRIHYFQTTRPCEFLMGFLKSTAARPFQWVKGRDKAWGKMVVGVEPSDTVWNLDITAVPNNFVISGDSWTAVAADALEIGNAAQAADLLDGVDQSIYGTANSKLTYITNLIQKDPRHWIIQAHGTKFEIYDKPIGVTAGEAKQKNMVLREIIDVPLSSSRPHGQVMASRFNHIGWMSVDGLGDTVIDFTRKMNRVGGGPPNKKDKAAKLSMLTLVGGTIAVEPEPSRPWYQEATHESLMLSTKKMVL